MRDDASRSVAQSSSTAELPEQLDRIEPAIKWLSDRSPALWRFIALALLTLLSAVTIFQSSAVINGTRYFWLNEDEMISMRYGRNLAEGQGLVWNKGERVEGYTNFLWTLVMAGVHLLQVTDAKASLVVKIINWLLACAILVLSERLLRFFAPRPGLALPALFMTLIPCLDFIYWAVNGFETTLLSATFLLVVIHLLEESKAGISRISTYLLMGLLPLVRSDAYYVWAAAALLSFGISQNRLRTFQFLGLSLVLPILHLLFRFWYYGDWLPNTYYLKVAGLKDRLGFAYQYLSRFTNDYSVALVLAAVGLLLVPDRRRWLLMGGLVIGACYVLVVGADVYNFSRYLAHLVPVIFVLALLCILESTVRLVPQFLLVLVFFVGSFALGGAHHLHWLKTAQGVPDRGMVAGMLIEKFTRPEAKVAVFAAGSLPYFSRRYSIDLLGKVNSYIAHQEPRCCGAIGHSKFDPEYTFAQNPDLVVAMWPHKKVSSDWWIESQKTGYGEWYVPAVVGHPTFRNEYRMNPVKVPFLLEKYSVYVRSSSPELARLSLWREPTISR